MVKGPAWLALAVILAAPGARAANPALAHAEQLLDKHDYRAAEKALQLALKSPGNDRDTLLKILEQQGVVAGFLNQPDRAKAAFRALLAIDPKHTLARDYAPRVTDPFKEAQKWAETKGPLRFDAVFAQAPSGPVVTLQAAISSDPLRMSRKVRFHYRTGNAAYRAQTVAARGQTVKLDVKARSVEWWAELLGDHDGVLAQIAGPAKPLKIVPEAPELVPLVQHPSEPEPQPEPEAGPPPKTATVPPASTSDLPVKPAPLHLPPAVSLEPKPAPPPVVAQAEQPRENAVTTPYERSTSGLRIASYVVLAAAAGAGAGGAYYGLQAQSARSQVDNAPQNSAGVVTTMKMTDAYALAAKVKKDAPIANALLGACGGLAVTGGVLWFLGRDTTVSVGPTAVYVSGVFP